MIVNVPEALSSETPVLAVGLETSTPSPWGEVCTPPRNVHMAPLGLLDPEQGLPAADLYLLSYSVRSTALFLSQVQGGPWSLITSLGNAGVLSPVDLPEKEQSVTWGPPLPCLHKMM